MKITIYKILVVPFFFVSVFLSLFVVRGNFRFDSCNASGFPLVSSVTGLCSGSEYPWVGINYVNLLINMALWATIFGCVIYLTRVIRKR